MSLLITSQKLLPYVFRICQFFFWKRWPSLAACSGWYFIMPKAQYLLFTSVDELDFQAIDTFKARLPFPVYAVSSTIPHLDLKVITSKTASPDSNDYLEWLDSQSKGSVLYVSLGSFLTVSSAQMDEHVARLQDSGVRDLWISREDDNLQFKYCCCDGHEGLVIPWCDQLRVLCHSSVGGF